MEQKTAIVTGGAGFIGAHLAKRLIKEGWKVYVLDNLSTGYISNVPEGAIFRRVDLDKEFIDKLPEEHIDVVFHIAGQSSGEISFENPEYDLRTNTLSTLKLLQWCHDNGVNRFIYASSVSVYSKDRLPMDESCILKPEALYGIGKLASEHYIRIYEKYGIKGTALRFFNVYGPGQNLENMKQGMVSIYMSYIANNEPILVKGSKDRYRDLVYIDDVVDAIIKIIDNDNAYNNIYNIGTGKATRVGELIDLIIKEFGYSEYEVKYTKETAGDVFGTCSSIRKIKEEIGWEPKVKLEDGIKLMVEWIKNGRTK